jgi:TPR repeat protein
MGYADAQYLLAMLYMEGRMTPKGQDLKNGLKYLALAAEQGHPDATYLYARILIEPTSYIWIKPGHSLSTDPVVGYKFVYISKALSVRDGSIFLRRLDEGREASVTPEARAEGRKLAIKWLSDFHNKQEESLAPERARRAELLKEMHHELGEELVNELTGFSKSDGSGRWRSSAP